MNLKMLFIITDKEEKLIKFVNKFKLPFSTIFHGIGTATNNILDFFGLVRTEKVILMSIIPSYREEEMLTNLRDHMKLHEIGNGIGFTVPLTSSSKYVKDMFYKEGVDENMKKKSNYHLVLAIVQEGYAEKVIDIAKKNGANGGTLIKGRGLGGKNSFKLFDMTIEPEKDIVMIVCSDEDKNKIMEGILDKVGIKKDGKGICLSLPIDSTIGIDEECQ